MSHHKPSEPSKFPACPPDKIGWPWTENCLDLNNNMPDRLAWPRVSIVTPSYNQAHFIEETIRSVLLQGYPNLEYIIIDGGSSDGSVEIIRKYEPWLAYWVSEKDRGQSHAINKGFQHATGSIVAWLNSDDYLERDAVTYAAQQLLQHPDWDMVYSDCHLINEQGQVFGRHYCKDFSWSDLLAGDIIPQQTVFLRRHILERVGGVNEDLYYIMDYEWWLRIARHGFQIQRLPGTWAYFRLVEGTKSVTHPSLFWEETIPLVMGLIVEDSGLNLECKDLIQRRVFYQAGISNIFHHDFNLGRAREHLKLAFADGGTPYKDLAYMAEDLVGRSKGNMQKATREQRDAFLKSFFQAAPESRMLCELQGRVAMVSAFEAYQMGDKGRMRRQFLFAIRHSASARRNLGLWKIATNSYHSDCIF